MKKFEELTLKELKELYKKVTEQEEEKDSLVRWRAKNGYHYYYIKDFGATAFTVDERYYCDNFRYDTDNYFETQEEAEEHKKKQIMQQQYRDWCKFDIDWNNHDQPKHYCRYNNEYRRLEYDWQYIVKTQGVVYAKSIKRIQEFIDKVGEVDFKKYILEVEE